MNGKNKLDYLEKINYISKNQHKKNNVIIEDEDGEDDGKSYEEEEIEKEEVQQYQNVKKGNNNERIQAEKVMNNKEENGAVKSNKIEISSKFQGLSDEELKKIRDKLLVERNDTNNLYNKIPSKVNKIGQIQKREELEKKLAEINKDLMQIRLKLKGNI